MQKRATLERDPPPKKKKECCSGLESRGVNVVERNEKKIFRNIWANKQPRRLTARSLTGRRRTREPIRFLCNRVRPPPTPTWAPKFECARIGKDQHLTQPSSLNSSDYGMLSPFYEGVPRVLERLEWAAVSAGSGSP